MNVSKGDLALVVSAMIPESIGSVVEVVDFVGDIQGPEGIVYKDCWWARAPQPHKCWTPVGQVIDNEGLSPDAWLRRIAGPSIKIDTETDQPIQERETA